MKQTLGILGGGQLGKMLLAETQRLGIITKVMDSSPDAPCRVGADDFVVGDINNFEAVVNFAQSVTHLTIEIEGVNVDALQALEKQGKKVFPSSSVLRIIKNKARQKEFYRQNNIPTAPFDIFENKQKLQRAVNEGYLKIPFVWKAAEGGYDGRGVQIVRSKNDIELLPDTLCVAEKLITFEKELAVVVVLAENGKTVCFPLVEMEFHPTANQVEFVLCPASVSDKIADKASKIALKVAKKLGSAGVFAVEMFLTKNGGLIVNETAPRVHNSGHLSIEACYTNQFEQHIRAVLGLPLGCSELRSPAVMLNIVGAKGFSGDVYYKNLEKAFSEKGVYPHIYGKAQTAPFRKMGHITVIDSDIEVARKKAEKIKKLVKVISK